MNFPRKLLLCVLIPIFTVAAADRCLAGCGLREFDPCDTAVVAPDAGLPCQPAPEHHILLRTSCGICFYLHSVAAS